MFFLVVNHFVMAPSYSMVTHFTGISFITLPASQNPLLLYYKKVFERKPIDTF